MGKKKSKETGKATVKSPTVSSTLFSPSENLHNGNDSIGGLSEQIRSQKIQKLVNIIPLSHSNSSVFIQNTRNDVVSSTSSSFSSTSNGQVPTPNPMEEDNETEEKETENPNSVLTAGDIEFLSGESSESSSSSNDELPDAVNLRVEVDAKGGRRKSFALTPNPQSQKEMHMPVRATYRMPSRHSEIFATFPWEDITAMEEEITEASLQRISEILSCMRGVTVYNLLNKTPRSSPDYYPAIKHARGILGNLSTVLRFHRSTFEQIITFGDLCSDFVAATMIDYQSVVDHISNENKLVLEEVDELETTLGILPGKLSRTSSASASAAVSTPTTALSIHHHRAPQEWFETSALPTMKVFKSKGNFISVDDYLRAFEKDMKLCVGHMQGGELEANLRDAFAFALVDQPEYKRSYDDFISETRKWGSTTDPKPETCIWFIRDMGKASQEKYFPVQRALDLPNWLAATDRVRDFQNRPTYVSQVIRSRIMALLTDMGAIKEGRAKPTSLFQLPTNDPWGRNAETYMVANMFNSIFHSSATSLAEYIKYEHDKTLAKDPKADIMTFEALLDILQRYVAKDRRMTSSSSSSSSGDVQDVRVHAVPITHTQSSRGPRHGPVSTNYGPRPR